MHKKRFKFHTLKYLENENSVGTKWYTFFMILYLCIFLALLYNTRCVIRREKDARNKTVMCTKEFLPLMTALSAK